VRIISSYFGLHDRAAVTREVDGFLAANAGERSRPKFSSGWNDITTKKIMPRLKISGVLGKIDNPPSNGFLVYLATPPQTAKFDESENALGSIYRSRPIRRQSESAAELGDER